MSNVLAVFGATGQQGRSVIDFVLNDAELSQQYSIRAITRDVNSERAKELKKMVEVVEGDAQDRSSIEKVLTGAHTVFAMTAPVFGPDSLKIEYECGKTIGDVAVEQGVRHIIFSTLPAVRENSGGKYTGAFAFDAKAKAERYIRGLNIKSTIYAPGWFMENFHVLPFLNPRKAPDGSWVLVRPISSKTRFPYIRVATDTGKFIGAILAEPEKYEGKKIFAAEGYYSLDETVALLSKVSGKKVVFKQVSVEEFKETIPPVVADFFADVMRHEEEYGILGPESEDLAAWAAENARGGKLSTFEEYFEAHPLQLE